MSDPKEQLSVAITRVKQELYGMKKIAELVEHREERREIAEAVERTWQAAEKLQLAIQRN